MCGCNGNINREVITSAQLAAQMAQREAEQKLANQTSTDAAIANASSSQRA